MKNFLAGILFTIVFCGIVLGGSFYFFDTGYKGDLYFKIATRLDEADPKGSVKAIRYYNKAIKTYEAVGDVEGEVAASIHLGLLHFKFGNILQVERLVLRALDLGKDNIPLPLQAKSYLLLAGTVAPDEAKNYIDKAMAIALQLDLQPQIVQSYFLLGKLEEYKAEFEKAEEYYVKAVSVVDEHPSVAYFVDMPSLYENLGELYAGGGEITKAIKFYDLALSVSIKETPQSPVVARYMRVLGDLYFERKEVNKACEYWTKSNEQYNFISTITPVEVGKPTLPDSCHNQVS